VLRQEVIRSLRLCPSLGPGEGREEEDVLEDPKFELSITGAYNYDSSDAELFAEATRHPAYHVTRSETEILECRSADIARIAPSAILIELGAGSCERSRILMRAFTAATTPPPTGGVSRGGGGLEEFIPIDINAGLLDEVCPQLASDFPSVCVTGVVADFTQQMEQLAEAVILARREVGERGLLGQVAFFGSVYGKERDFLVTTNFPTH
jgi:uncharacterized SAM-dependent methyltransferase